MLLSDIRYALRRIAHRPRTSAVVALTLALGIGATTAVFSVVDAVLLAPLPYAAPDRLVGVYEMSNDGVRVRHPTSWAGLEAWRARTTAFERLAAYKNVSLNLGAEEGAEQVSGVRVTADMLATLGLAPALGRGFEPSEEVEGAPPVALTSYELWERRFGRDPGVVGRTIVLDGRTFTVVGVLPKGIRFPAADTDVWIPLVPNQGERAITLRSFRVVGRLAPAATLARANEEIKSVMVDLEREHFEYVGTSGHVVPLAETIVGDVRPALLSLFGAAFAVLVVACINVASIQLAQVASRRHEISIRAAIGGGRTALVRQLLVESVVLSLAGAALGVAVAAAGVPVLVAMAGAGLPRAAEIRTDLGVLAVATAAAVACGVASGIVPALQLSRVNLTRALGSAGRGAVSSQFQIRLLGGLVASEVALALALLVAASLMVRSFQSVAAVDPGFEPHGVLTATVSLAPAKYPDPKRQQAFYDGFLERVAALPGIEGAAAVMRLPLAPNAVATVDFSVQDHPVPLGQEPVADYRAVTPYYFDVLRIPLLEGRNLARADAEDSGDAIVVNAALARQQWPNESAIGKRIFLAAEKTRWREIVGVVGDVKMTSLDKDVAPAVYVPFPQSSWPNSLVSTAIVVRGRTADAALASAIRAELARFDPAQALSQIRPMEEVIGASVGSRRLSTSLAGLFALLAGVLAAIGIYGMMDFMVAERRREIGVRVAVGARPRDVALMVVRRGVALALGGVLGGISIAVALARVLSGFLFGVSATDPATFAAVACLVLATAVVACAVPARAAARVDALAALRSE